MLEESDPQTSAGFPMVVVGTYEEFLLGYRIIKEEKKVQFVSTFAEHAHKASIRCVSTDNGNLASSGADEYINLYDMISLMPTGIIPQDNGTVNCLEFTPDGNYLICGCQDGSIAIYQTRSRKLVKLWKQAHKHANGVISLSIHPSGKLALSLGADNVLRTWNLIKGRQAYAVNLAKKCTPGNGVNMVCWSYTGDRYALCIGSLVELYSVKTAGVIFEVRTTSKISSVTFSQDNLMIIGTETGVIEVHNIEDQVKLMTKGSHDGRIKCLRSFQMSTNDKVKSYLVSADSAGVIKFWMFKNSAKKKLLLKGEINVDCRITCLTLVDTNRTVKKEESEKVKQEMENKTTDTKKRKAEEVESEKGVKKSKKVINGKVKQKKKLKKKEKVVEEVLGEVPRLEMET